MDSPMIARKRQLIKLTPLTPETPTRNLNMEPFELQSFLGNNVSGFWNAGCDNESTRSLINEHDSEQQQQMLHLKEKADMLFPQFLEVLQSRTNESEVFDTIQDLIQICVGTLEQMQVEIEQKGDGGARANAARLTNIAWLEQEVKTWKLLYALYKDRVTVQNDGANMMDCEALPLIASEKEIVSHLYTVNSTLREHQLIVDWLEATYEKRAGAGPEIGHFTDRTVGWENTLFQLKNQREAAFGHGVDIVKSLDPDAPIREKRPLHALDEEDNLRLSRCIFQEIRQGRIDEAMSLCKYCGQTWRAVILEGWRLHEDPNYDLPHNVHEKLPIEGNPRRDIWKKCAWAMADSKKFDEYTRAIAGSFCGHLESLKALLCNSWEDLLWAYLKVQIDIRVENEIRTCGMRNYHSMPEAYWESKMSMEQIFDELAAHKDAAVREYAESKMGLIQKHLVMDNVNELLHEMQRWLTATRHGNPEHSSGSINKTSLSPHLLRFLSHIVLFMRQIGRVEKEDVADEIISAYVETLIGLGDAQLVAFYTAALPSKLQISLYSQFLEGITATEARSAALTEAINAGLDVESITRHTVDTIRQSVLNDATEGARLPVGEISKFDERKIRALEWLTFLPAQRGELLWQANSMIRFFLAEGKAECVRAAFEMVPVDSIAILLSTFGSESNLPCREDCSMKEYISYKVYLVALDSFNDWTQLYHNQPKKPQIVNADANFTERVASEHREQVYRAELNRWNISLEEQVKLTRDALYNVLVFPGLGWLIDPVTTKEPAGIKPSIWENRRIQMEKLRSICIPEIVLLLHKLLHQTGDFQGCVNLSEVLADENQKLYKVYTKHKLADILFKLAESSRELLNAKLDPWGFPTTL